MGFRRLNGAHSKLTRAACCRLNRRPSSPIRRDTLRQLNRPFSSRRGHQKLAGGGASLCERNHRWAMILDSSSSSARTHGAFRISWSQKCAGQTSPAGGIRPARCCAPNYPAASWVCFPGSIHDTGGVRSQSLPRPPANLLGPFGTAEYSNYQRWFGITAHHSTSPFLQHRTTPFLHHSSRPPVTSSLRQNLHHLRERSPVLMTQLIAAAIQRLTFPTAEQAC